MKEFVLQGGSFGNRHIDYAAELNDEQRAVVEQGDGAALVIAGAGSGKTRTITYRVAWLLDHGVPPDRILLLTFTNKAAREMMQRVELLLGAYPQGMWAGTFHSIANRILRQHGHREGYPPNFSILDEEDANSLVKQCVKALKADAGTKKFPSPAVIKSIVSYSRNAQVSVGDVLEAKYPHLIVFQDELTRIGAMYEAQKREHNALDFDDLLTVLLSLVRNHPDVKRQLAEQFAYVFVDEFQDTNIIQAEIVHELASVHGNILAVGDDAQSIYSFRAAEIRNMLDFPRRYADAKIFRLVTNYRSTPQILAVANAVIGHNTQQFQKELVAAINDGDLPQLVPANSAAQEGQFVVEQIAQLMSNGEKPKSIAVLFRAAFHSQQVEFELMKRGIAYEYRGGMKFFERAHIKDALAFLRVISNVRDVMAWMRILSLQPGFGPATAASAATTLAAGEGIDTALSMTPVRGLKAGLGWQTTVKILRTMLATKTVAEHLRALAGNDDYQTHLETEYPNYRDRLDDLEQLATFAEQYATIRTFLDSVTLTGDFGGVLEDPTTGSSTGKQEDRLVLSTIHQAKGLEWQTVFILNLSDGGFPSARAMEEDGGLEEERRLFYVAATRARRRLFLTYPITAGYEHVELRQPSQFLTEIPKTLYEEVRLRYGGYASRATLGASPPRKSWYEDGGSDEPTIVLDASGERIVKPAPGSFLRNVDEL